MATHLTQRRLIIQDENLGTHLHKALVDGKTKSSKPAAKKGAARFGSRKALNDITNKSSLHRKASPRKKNAPTGEFNIAEEMFLHDHKKCIEAQQTKMEPCFLDTVLPGHDSVVSVPFPESKPAKADLDSPRCYPEPTELPMSEFSDHLQSSSQWDSPQYSPIHWDSHSPPSSPFAWKFEMVEFLLKQEDDFI